ncbi:RNA-binding domain-containing protein [Cylindrospermopsis raciborskii]|uniref:RNA-binding domain-containing protein n=1 Tax=Cylindrospermopsis raciborskii TaxID=77022 RepID=UPI000778AC4F|nr:RNA-binding domain-containing protein [Cylindrospermopsis raciborskii]MCZ2202176.1 putative DNA binding domain-containing protein [Cylindrospermopsis raciborskii PAMP2012]MCZ2205284.1 putative DNA binding domain-containing protein [Cylindrospermopsis raciborskii PAMP2011]
MNINYIIELINQGENSSVEFKRSDVKLDSLCKEIIAFSNSSGGVVLIGVDDDGTILGVESDRNYEEWVVNIARNNIIPPVNIQSREVVWDGKKIVVVEVPKGKDRPYQDNSGRFYIRIGSTNRIASLNELMRLFQQSGLYHFDVTAVDNTSPSYLNHNAIDRYFHSYDVHYMEMEQEEKITLLKNTDIIAENEQVTVGGLLVFGINPQRIFHNASISFAHFLGDTISEELIDKKNIEGSLPDQVQAALQIIKNNILTPSSILETRRDERIKYPDKVFRELIVNACVHRNYSITGSRIRIFMFHNRIEFMSPGKLPNTVTIDKLRFGVSYSINPVIVKFMENLRYIDKLGRGLPMVYQEAKKIGKDVLFEEIGEEFKVTLLT